MEEINSVEKYVCCDCWLKVETFHEFHFMIEQIHCNHSAQVYEVVKCDIELDSEYESSTHDKDDIKIEIDEPGFIQCKNEPNDEPSLNEMAVEMKPSVENRFLKCKTRSKSSNEKQVRRHSFTHDQEESQTMGFLAERHDGFQEPHIAEKSRIIVNLGREKSPTQLLITYKDFKLTDLQCDICGKWMKNQKTLRKHKQTHEKVLLNCRHCDKVNFNARSLKKHIAVAHSTPKHKCNLCDKSFTRLQVLRVCKKFFF